MQIVILILAILIPIIFIVFFTFKNTKYKKGVKPFEFHTFTYEYLYLFNSDYLTSSKINTLYPSATCVSVLQISCKPENKHP